MTAQRAADLERQAIRAYVRRLRKLYTAGEALHVVFSLLNWLDSRSARCNKRKGGLGRKKR